MKHKKDTEYRNCIEENADNNCPYVMINKNGTEICRIDGIIQVRWYSCIPQKEIDKRKGKKWCHPLNEEL